MQKLLIMFFIGAMGFAVVGCEDDDGPLEEAAEEVEEAADEIED